MPKGTMRKVF